VALQYNVLVLSGMNGYDRSFVTSAGERLYNNTFATMTPASSYFDEFFRLVKMQGHDKIALVYSRVPGRPYDLVVTESIDMIFDHNLRLVASPYVIPSAFSLDKELEAQAMAEIFANISKIPAELHPDVLVVSALYACETVPPILRRLNLNFKVIGVFECLNNISPLDQSLQDDLRYFIVPQQWDYRLTGIQYTEPPSRPYASMFPYNITAARERAFRALEDGDEVVLAANESTNHPSAAQFYEAYQNAARTLNVDRLWNSLAASEKATWDVISFIISVCRCTSRACVLSCAYRVDLNTAYGPIRFNVNGLNTAKTMVYAQLSVSRDMMPITLGSYQPVWTMPTWAERNFDGSYFSTDQTVVLIACVCICIFVGGVTMVNLYHRRAYPLVKAISLPLSLVTCSGMPVCLSLLHEFRVLFVLCPNRLYSRLHDCMFLAVQRHARNMCITTSCYLACFHDLQSQHLAQGLSTVSDFSELR